MLQNSSFVTGVSAIVNNSCVVLCFPQLMYDDKGRGYMEAEGEIHCIL